MATSKAILDEVTDLARWELAAEDEVEKARARVFHVDATEEDIDEGGEYYMRAKAVSRAIWNEILTLEGKALEGLDPDGEEADLVRREIKHASMIPTFERHDAARAQS